MNINITDVTENPGTPMAQIEIREIRRSQINDQVIGKWRTASIDQKIIDKTFTKSDQTMKRNFKHFKIERGILFREIEDNEEKI